MKYVCLAAFMIGFGRILLIVLLLMGIAIAQHHRLGTPGFVTTRSMAHPAPRQHHAPGRGEDSRAALPNR